MFNDAPMPRREAMVAPAPELTQQQIGQPQDPLAEIRYTYAEEQRVSGIRDQSELMRVLETPGTKSTVLGCTFDQLARFGNAAAIETPSKFAPASRNDEQSPLRAYSLLAGIVLQEKLPLRPKLRESEKSR